MRLPARLPIDRETGIEKRKIMETVFPNMEPPTSDVSREKLKDDLRVLIQDAEDLLRATAGDLSDKAKEARSRLGDTLEKARATCRRLEEKTVAVAKATDKVIRDHPYESIGVAFGVGLLIGILVTRK
jgi:ElaB/YqjD/DUF883 family membrane-anchored ribosome-binding protein